MTSVKPRQKAVHVGWEQWQGSAISQQFLSAEARQKGYTVLRVLPACRALFLDLAPLLLTYGDLVHKHHAFTRDTQEALATWYQAMQRLKAALAQERS